MIQRHAGLNAKILAERDMGPVRASGRISSAVLGLLALAVVGCAKEVVPIPDVRPAPPAVRAPAAPPSPAPAPVPVTAPPPAAGEPGPAPGGAEAAAGAPTFRVGDEWRWVGGGVTRVAAVEGGLHVVEERDGKRRYFEPTWTLVKVVDRAGAVVADSQAGRRVLDFPLRVGKEWSWRGAFPGPRGRAPRPYVDRYRVTGQEDVSVRAGTFRAFVIEHVQEVPAQGALPAAEARRTLWYSPDAKVFVKVQAHSPGWSGGELESYGLK